MTQAARDSNDLDSHYTIISVDCHAGGSHQQYREYLDPQYLDDFDAWRGRYKNPFRDLQDGGRIRNWDDDRRNSDLEGQGLVAEVVFPNTRADLLPELPAKWGRRWARSRHHSTCCPTRPTRPYSKASTPEHRGCRSVVHGAGHTAADDHRVAGDRDRAR